MTSPAPLDVIRDKLGSPDEDARNVALLHAAAHGEAARSLASTIAKLFEDPSLAVQWQAVQAFARVGPGAEEAVPVLVAQLEKRHDTKLVGRALSALGRVGKAARAALDAIFDAMASHPSHGGPGLESMVRIAPDDARVKAELVAAAFSDDYAVSSAAHRALEGAPDSIAEAVLDEARDRLGRAGPRERFGVAQVGSALASRHPDEVIPLLRDLLTRRDEPCLHVALFAASRLPNAEPLLAELHLALGAGERASEQTAKVLARIGPAAAPTKESLQSLLATHEEAWPTSGPDGEPARVFAEVALALSVIAPDDATELERLTSWLSRMATLEWGSHRPSWFTIGDVVVAAARFRGAVTAIDDCIVRAVEAARPWLALDESGVAELHRRIRSIAAERGNPEALWARLEPLGLEREAPLHSVDEELPLPPLPPERKPPTGRVLPLTPDVVGRLVEAITLGAALADVTPEATPSEIASAVERVVRQARDGQRALSDAECDSLGVLWGKAASQAGGFTWARVLEPEGEVIALLSVDHAHLCDPLSFLRAQARAGRELRVIALFDAIRKGALPASRPDALARVD